MAARATAVRSATRNLDPRTLGVTTGRGEPPRAVDLKRDLILHLVAAIELFAPDSVGRRWVLEVAATYLWDWHLTLMRRLRKNRRAWQQLAAAVLRERRSFLSDCSCGYARVGGRAVVGVSQVVCMR